MKFFNRYQGRPMLALLILLLFSFPAAAERTWMYVGSIDQLDLKSQTVIVNDLVLKITASSKITSYRGGDISARLLKPGDLVGVDAEYRPPIGRLITELHVYPANAKPIMKSEDD